VVSGEQSSSLKRANSPSWWKKTFKAWPEWRYLSVKDWINLNNYVYAALEADQH
jgi:hypothetical protein